MGIQMSVQSSHYNFHPTSSDDDFDEYDAELDQMLEDYLMDIPEITDKTVRKDDDLYRVLD